ncbi:MAG: GNAT family N-acetyltransferase [Acidobacteria bacterium]|nr:MAG: GNAT family N-acetyltransferase [Acidobacteriota bacterium]REJ98421.1 MAG: GNAT family N-acetyltransferase [Acidobacteriota bacterium]REK16930.1 MAG: GNAT family N-acetyltransferase [Acidobacteriota bacterium]REK43077.1 MAG: GNAT family N-acetyltransferase [Acidobacteriota bacterium]
MQLREITNADTQECGRIIYEAFRGIDDQHNFPYDFADREAGLQFAEMVINSPDIWGVAAEENGKFVGSNFLWEFDEIVGVGPITVDPSAQEKGIGRKLMQAVIERGKDAPGIRLLQAAYNARSMSLYTALGFDIREPIVVISGSPEVEPSSEYTVRRFEEDDLEACSVLHICVHGYSRRRELRSLSKNFPSCVVEKDGEIRGYMTAPNAGLLNHSIAKKEADMEALIAGAAKITGEPISFLLPTRQADLFRWCLKNGFRVGKPFTLMSMGDYREPRGIFTPSVLY